MNSMDDPKYNPDAKKYSVWQSIQKTTENVITLGVAAGAAWFATKTGIEVDDQTRALIVASAVMIAGTAKDLAKYHIKRWFQNLRKA